MGKFSIVMPKLGESIIEATITRWLKKEGDKVSEDDALVEIATDKVDSEIPSPVEGILSERFFKEGDVVAVGKVIAVIEISSNDAITEKEPLPEKSKGQPTLAEKRPLAEPGPKPAGPVKEEFRSDRFYSPLVRNIAKKENIPAHELDKVPGTGQDGRVTRQDMLNYLDSRKDQKKKPAVAPPPVSLTGGDQIIEMDRIRQLIAGHMIRSVQASAHVTSIVEADVTKIVRWREKNKGELLIRENEKLTYTPIFIEAIAKAVKDYPMVNVSVDGTRIIVHKNINIGMAVALPDFNLIVPVIKNANEKNLLGLVRSINDIADRARRSKLIPDEIAGGTISLTNLGSSGTLMGTPIINQPQCAIVAVGSIKKRPVVIETPEGDTIAIRQMMFVSLTYDHRVIDGSLAGQFLNRLVEHLENFNTSQTI